MIKGYIFDMDGTLIDSMSMICGMDRHIFEKLGLEFTEEAEHVMKYIPLGESAKYIKSSFDTPYTENEITRVLMDTMTEGYLTVERKKGVLEYLRFCEKSGVKMAIATATEPAIATAVASRLGIFDYMETLVACSDVGVPKTRPDVFLECASRLGLPVSECAVFEDGLPGLRSSRDAGFTTVGVWDATASAEDERFMREISDVYIKDFNELKDTLI